MKLAHITHSLPQTMMEYYVLTVMFDVRRERGGRDRSRTLSSKVHLVYEGIHVEILSKRFYCTQKKSQAICYSANKIVFKPARYCLESLEIF